MCSLSSLFESAASNEKKAESSREIYFSLDFTNRNDCLAVESILTGYSDLVDDMKNGLNNYADGALFLAEGCINESSHWRSALSVDNVMNRMEFEPLQSTFITSRRESLVEEVVNDLCRNLFSLIDLVGDDKKESSNASQSNNSDNSINHLSHHITRTGGKRQCVDSVATPVEQSKPVKTCENWSSQKKQPNENTLDEPQISLFRTAGSLLNQKLKSQFSESGIPSTASYGTSKRSLGGRRGPRSCFVPPVGSNSSLDTSLPAFNSKGISDSLRDQKSDTSPIDERLKQFDQKIVEMIMSEIMEPKASITWDDIAGLEFSKKTLQEIVILPMLRPDLFTGLRGPPKGLLLFGPPGTGKTLIGKCIASQSKSTFFSISASSLTSKWVGEGEKMVRALFAVARIHQPAVIFIDEVDSLLAQRSETEHESSRRIKTEFLVQLDGVATGENERILFIGATNRPQELDEAARRRFVKRLYIPLPTRLARKQIVQRLLGQHRHKLEEDEFTSIADRAEGYSGADMANLCREAAMGPIRSLSLETIQSITCEDVRPVELNDFHAAFGQVRASVSSEDLELYLKWNHQYGSFEA